jgi:amino acid transporter
MSARSTMSFFSLILLGINSIVGSGIFLLPGQVMALAGSWSLVVYLLVTVFVMAIGWCFAQCASLFHRNGGAYIYAKEAFGEFIGFEIGIMRWVVGMIAWAALAVGFVTALGALWPLANQDVIRTLLILSLINGLGCLNILGVKGIRHLNNIITVAKLVPLVFFVCITIFYIQLEYLLPFTPIDFPVTAVGPAALVVFYAFSGFETLAMAAQDMKNPTKHIPLAVMIVIAIAALLYFFIQLIAIGTLGPALSTSVTPIADVAHILFGTSAKWLIGLAMLISIGGVNIAASMITPRNGVVLAEDGLVSAIIAKKGRFDTPYIAILIGMVVASFTALSGSFIQLITISVVSRFAQHITTCLAVFVFHKRLFKTKMEFYKLLIPVVALIGLIFLLLHTTYFQVLFGLGGLFIGAPFYFIAKAKKTQILQS